MNKNIQSLKDKSFFYLRNRIVTKFSSFLLKLYWKILGMQIGSGTKIGRFRALWPHKVSIGKDCSLEPGVIFTYNGPWSHGKNIVLGNNIFIGRGCEFNIKHGITIKSYSNISSGCKFIDHNHGIKLGELIGPQADEGAPVLIEEDVWLGVNVVVLKGVTIGKGAVVGAGAVVTKSIPANEIWGGIPAKKIGERK